MRTVALTLAMMFAGLPVANAVPIAPHPAADRAFGAPHVVAVAGTGAVQGKAKPSGSVAGKAKPGGSVNGGKH
ncbi:MAG: hypothetical protein JO128_22740 [Alphaproteobacteria bacterium]|nr:hypothetical protein [Alphaproteobacteria bacterium]